MGTGLLNHCKAPLNMNLKVGPLGFNSFCAVHSFLHTEFESDSYFFGLHFQTCTLLLMQVWSSAVFLSIFMRTKLSQPGRQAGLYLRLLDNHLNSKYVCGDSVSSVGWTAG